MQNTGRGRRCKKLFRPKARKLQIALDATAYYHVISQCVRRAFLCGQDSSRAGALNIGVNGSKNILKFSQEFFIDITAYAIMMDDHYHLMVETVEGNLSKGMRQLNGVYTRAHNRRHNWVGHVFQGRFKGILVDAESYLLELSRYVVLNPLRAGMVKQLRHWKWSSYRAMTGQGKSLEWLETEFILGHFGKQRKRAIARYIEFVRVGKELESMWDEKIHPVILGDEAF